MNGFRNRIEKTVQFCKVLTNFQTSFKIAFSTVFNRNFIDFKGFIINLITKTFKK